MAEEGRKTPRFSPLNTPMERRLQTATVLWHTVSIPLFLTIFLVLLAVPLFWVLTVPYLLYITLDRTPSNGGVVHRRWEWFRSLKVWSYFCNYFPIVFYKTHELEPTFTEVEIANEFYNFYFFKIKRSPYKKKIRTGPKYIFGIHPHGVVSLSGFGSFGTNGAGFVRLFPGIPVCLLTLLNNFYVPFYREYLLSLGITSASRSNALKVLRSDFSLAIVVGGAQESLLAKPSSNDIVLQKRKGFVKLAMETGNVGLVPTYCFGENDLYEIIEPTPDSFGRKIQIWLKRNFGFTVPFFHARGIFNYDFGLLPYRKRVTIVTGKPIIVPFLPSPKKQEVDHYHQLYVDELQRIFDKYRGEFDENGDSSRLNIVE